MNARAPPATQASRNHGASGTAAATAGDRKRMPPPMTLATMMAAASRGPSRRSRTGDEVVVVVTRGLYGWRLQLPTANFQKEIWELGVGNCELSLGLLLRNEIGPIRD